MPPRLERRGAANDVVSTDCTLATRQRREVEARKERPVQAHDRGITALPRRSIHQVLVAIGIKSASVPSPRNRSVLTVHQTHSDE